jgi:hypothetical protein
MNHKRTFSKFPRTNLTDSLRKTVVGGLILETGLFTLLCNMFRLLPSYHHVNNGAAEINFHQTESREGVVKGATPKIEPTICSPVLPFN